MPDVLTEIADADTAVLQAWLAGATDRAPQFDALPAEARKRELLTLAREFVRRATWAADTADGWLEELLARLRVGMNGIKLRALLDGGRALCGTCRSVAELAGDLWTLTGEPAHAALASVDARLAVVEGWIAKLLPRANAKFDWDKIDHERHARGEQQIKEGKGLTREQALAAIRKAE
jgi:hypothetical protein